MKKINIKAFDDTQIGLDVWDDVKNHKACIVIVHGMAEHPSRYDEFAKFLNSKGYLVAADDHRGHRRGAYKGIKGLVNGDSWNQTINDIDTLVDYMKETYKVKVAIVGHSYGSFLSQCYVERYSKKIEGCILSGTAYMKSPLTKIGKLIANLLTKTQGEDKPGTIMDKMSFGAYNKPFLEQGQDFAWLNRDKEQVAIYEADPECGYVLCNGYYSSFLNGVTKLYGADARTIAKDFPIMISVGGSDPVSNSSKMAVKLKEFYEKIGLKPEMKIYEGARHEILNELNKKEVYKSGNKIYFLCITF